MYLIIEGQKGNWQPAVITLYTNTQRYRGRQGQSENHVIRFDRNKDSVAKAQVDIEYLR